MSQTVLEVMEELEFSYPTDPRFRYRVPAGLRLTAGQAWSLSGHSGSGKSTLMTLLSALRPPNRGRIRYPTPTGRQWEATAANWQATAGPGLWRWIGFAFQRPEFLQSLSVEGNLRLVLPAEEAAAPSLFRATEWREIRHKRVGQLSGGQLQRLGLLRAFGANQALVFLDEPTNNLDIRNREEVADFVQYHRTGRGLVVVSHDRDFLDVLGVEKRFEVAAQPLTDGTTARTLHETSTPAGTRGIAARLLLWGSLTLAGFGLAAPSAALPLAMTPENVQKKAVVIRQNARLFAAAQGDGGKPAAFMQVYFLLQGETAGRIPVTTTPNKQEPDGWLAKDSFTEWNTIQMINFEPQSGRELARIFDNAGCAESFGQAGIASGNCKEYGSEPQRTGKQKDNYTLLIPLVGRDRDNFQGGFVRVSADGPRIAPVADREVSKTGGGSGVLGYDLVFAVDSTASMEKWFKPTTEVLNDFIQALRQRSGGEVAVPFRVGLLFYRDRKSFPDCDIEYLFRWEAELTTEVAVVSRALAGAERTECNSDETAEAVYDGLSRAVQDPKWNDGHLKVVFLVGDSPPHPPSNKDKNPLGLDVEAITTLAEERKVRILAFKVGATDEEEFKSLAEGKTAAVRGKYRAIPSDEGAYKSALLSALNEEWDLLTATNRIAGANITQSQAAADPSKIKQVVPNVSDYDLPIIIANLPTGSAGSGAPEYVAGWVPRKIRGQLAFGEFLFMAKPVVQSFANVIESIALAAAEGATEGSDAFLRSLRNSLAQSLGMQPDDVFRSGESLESMLEKAKILPFKTTVLSFTAEEVNAWKPSEYERLNKILQEKATHLREFAQKPGNARLFGDKAHLYVPRDLFP